MPNLSLTLIVRTRQQIIYQAEVNSVSSRNLKGPFDILPGHAFFISLIQDKIVARQKDGQTHQIAVGTGVLDVEDNVVHVYIEETATSPS